MTIGERKIRGIIREREEARADLRGRRAPGLRRVAAYAGAAEHLHAVGREHRAGQADRREHPLLPHARYVDGWYEFVFPMVVGPRFNPPGSTDGIGAVPRHGAPRADRPGTEVQYLKPDERSGHDIALSVDIDAGVEIEELKSVSHEIKRRAATDETRRTVDARERRTRSRTRTSSSATRSPARRSSRPDHVHGTSGRSGYFTLMLFPPADADDLPRKPLELVFIARLLRLMAGQPIEQAKAAIAHALDDIEPDDTFQIIRFVGNAEQIGDRAGAGDATRTSREALRLHRADSTRGGGTMMIEGIRAVAQVSRTTRERLRFVAFLTDGFIGNEARDPRRDPAHARRRAHLQLRRRLVGQPLPARPHGHRLGRGARRLPRA